MDFGIYSVMDKQSLASLRKLVEEDQKKEPGRSMSSSLANILNRAGVPFTPNEGQRSVENTVQMDGVSFTIHQKRPMSPLQKNTEG